MDAHLSIPIVLRGSRYLGAMTYDAIINALIKRREARGLKQESLAVDLGHTQGWLSHIEKKRRLAAWDDLREIAAALDCTLTVEILEHGDSPDLPRLVDEVTSLPDEKREMVRRFIRLLRVMEPRDVRREAADFEVLEEEYGLPVGNDESPALRRA